MDHDLAEFYRCCFERPGDPQTALHLARTVSGLGNTRPRGCDDLPTALSVAVVSNMPLDVIQALVENGSDAALPSIMGTPMHSACEVGRIDAAKLFRDRQPCSVHTHDPRGRTPVAVARERRYDDLVAFLERAIS